MGTNNRKYLNAGCGSERAHIRMGLVARKLAFRAIVIFFIGTLLGSLAPETGTVLAYNLGLFSHIFNPLFLAIGIVGIGLALYSRHRKG